MTETNTIVIKPIGKIKFSGLSSYSKATWVLSTELDASGYKTGLTKEEETYYEELLGLPKGKLGRSSDWWGSLAIRLNMTKATEFPQEDLMNQIKYKVMLASSKVADSVMEKNKFPTAEFVIVDEEAVAKLEGINIDYEIEAYEEFLKTTSEEKRGMLKLFGKRGFDKSTDSLVKSTLGKILKENPKGFLDVIKDKKIKTRVFIEELLEAGIIKKKGNYFTNGDDPIGNSTDEVVLFFEDLKNQSVKMALTGKLKDYKKAK